jgi:hypothetical protein
VTDSESEDSQKLALRQPRIRARSRSNSILKPILLTDSDNQQQPDLNIELLNVE